VRGSTISVAYAKGRELDRWPAGKRRPRGNRGAPLPTGLPPRRPVSCGENGQSARVAKVTKAEVGEPRCWRVRYRLILPSRLFVRLTVNPQMTALVQPICCRLLAAACPSYDQSSRNNSAPIPGASSTSSERPRNSSASSKRRTNTQPSRARSTNVGFRPMSAAGWSRIGGGIEWVFKSTGSAHWNRSGFTARPNGYNYVTALSASGRCRRAHSLLCFSAGIIRTCGRHIHTHHRALDALGFPVRL